MAIVHKGSCLCGEVKFETDTEPHAVCLCHCRMCARHTGAPFVMLAVYPAASVRISGETYGYRSSEHVDRRGCAKCGAPVFIFSDSDPEEVHIEIYVGAMDEPKTFHPEYEIFDQHRPGWLPALEGVPTYTDFKN